MANERIMIVEDEPAIAELVEYNLKKEGYLTQIAADGEKALSLIRQELPHLILLDIMLPGLDGLEVCKHLKQDPATRNIYIIMVSAKGEEADVVVGLQLGADGYVTKPFSPKVLTAKIKATLRRRDEKTGTTDDPIRQFNELAVYPTKFKVTVNGKPIDLTISEFNILEFLSRHPGLPFSRDQIMDGAWKEERFSIDRTVDVHIRSLRKKLGAAAEWIQTVRGVGYRFMETSSDE